MVTVLSDKIETQNVLLIDHNRRCGIELAWYCLDLVQMGLVIAPTKISGVSRSVFSLRSIIKQFLGLLLATFH